MTTAGKVGAEAARSLAQHETPARVLVRDPRKAAAPAQAGVDVVIGDLDDRDTVDAAMRDVSAVILVSPAIPAQEITVIDSAVAAGVSHVVKVTSKVSSDSPSPAGHAGKTYWPTGPASLSYAEAAEELSAVLGRPITFRSLTFEEQKQDMVDAGVPERIAEMNAQAIRLFAEGDSDWVTDDVPAILGRPAGTFRQFVVDHVAAFR
ncbi:NAD(P)H-binding protein [Paractinoplanes toevensis]|nr:NAD(P)H-binding protein [Actinoplanes toevensis]